MRRRVDEAVAPFAMRMEPRLSNSTTPSTSSEILQRPSVVMAAEAASVHSDWLDEFSDDYPPRIRDLIMEGRSLVALDYLRG